MKIKKHRKLKIAVLVTAISLFVFLFVINPIASAIVYEAIFSSRFEVVSAEEESISLYEGLSVERNDFYTKDGVRLAGYRYSRPVSEPKGVVVISHGMGCGGHFSFLPYIDVFTSEGYLVFAYDVTGTGYSEGESVEGLPQGVIDLDHALNCVNGIDEYDGLPVMLFGHSWGGFSVGNVLNMHPEVSDAVIVSGFNSSEDMLLSYAQRYVGPVAKLLLAPVKLYENVKFGEEYTDITAVDGMKNTDAQLLIVHSTDDTTVLYEYGYGTFYGEFSDLERFEFISYSDMGHTDILYSENGINGEITEKALEMFAE